MDIEQALELANNVLSGQMNRRLSDVETLILRGAWDRQTYEDIAAASSYAESYIRKDAGPKLWRDLATALGEPLSKTNFRAALERRWEKKAITASPIAPSVPQADYPHRKTDWGEAMDVSVFFGRSAEQETLTQWVSTDRCRFILLLGMGGMGKTALSVKVGQQVQLDFEFVIWRSLRNAPPLLDLLADLIKFLSQQQDVQIPSTAEAGVSQLLQYLRKYRCLLMLDNAESILQAGDRRRSYRPDYEGYGQLFQKVGETSHLSCLIVTSRELPQGLEKQMGKELPVRSLTISGLLSHDGQAFLESIAKFQGSTAEWEAILQRYAGNPLALKIVASFIEEILAGDLHQFLSFLGESSFIFDDIRDLLDQQFLRLSPQEKAVMIWLAIKRESVTLNELAEDLVAQISPPELLQLIMALQGRSLIEKIKNQFTQQPVVMEYITDAFIEQISQQICGWQVGDSTDDLNGLHDYTLIHIDAQEYVREAQRHLILRPIIQKLLAHFKDVLHLTHHVQHILAALRENEPQKIGYGAGNIINILHFLGVDLTGYDFSHLTLWQANLQGLQLHHVDLSGADLSKIKFTKTFSGVMSLVFSPDGQFLASGDIGCNIILWRLQDNRELMMLTGHKLWVSSLAFSLDSQLLASGSSDYSVRLWDAHSGQCLQVLLGHESAVYTVAFSLDQRMIASGSDDQTARVWDVLTGNCLYILRGHNSYIRAVAFSADGRYLMTGSNDCTVKIWDLQSGQLFKSILVILGHSAAVWTVSMSSDGELIASSSLDLTVRIWHIRTGQCLQILRGHTAEIWSIRFNPNGLTVASASLDRTVRVWDIQSGECLYTFQGHTDQVWSAAFHPNGQKLASGGIDQTIRLWDLETGHCTRTWQGYSNHIYAVTFSQDGTLLASVGDDAKVHLWNWQNGECVTSLTGHGSAVWAVAFHPNYPILASGGLDQTIRLWNFETPHGLQTLTGLTKWVYSVAFHPSGQMLASSSTLPIILLWDTTTGRRIKMLHGHTDPVWSVAFSPDGSQLVSISADRTVKIWDIATGVCWHTLIGHHDGLYSVKTFLPPDCRDKNEITAIEQLNYRIASAGADRTIRIWDSQTGACLRTLEGHTDWIYEIAIHPNGKYLASASHDTTVRLWDLQTGNCLAILPHETPLWSVVYHPEGHLLAACGWNNRIAIWDIQTETIIQSLELLNPYHGLNIRGCTGLTSSQTEMLHNLGAIS